MSRLRLPWLWPLVAIALLIGGLQSRNTVREVQVREDLSITGDDRSPPELTVAMTLGVFRSVILDVLWMRAAALQQEKRFYEIVQLYDLIGKLQPHNPRVWTYSAWNMAYNISVMHPAGKERWRWVINGLDRLVDHGLRYNPHDLRLFKETSWIFSHKMGKNLDDAHLLYKMELCRWVQDIFGTDRASAQAVLEALKSSDETAREKAQATQQRLKEELGMDLDFMAEMEQDPIFGPLDWRIPQVHAMYWARKGLSLNRFDQNVIDLERQIYQSQQVLLRQGTLVHLPGRGNRPERLLSFPDFRQALPMQEMFERQLILFGELGKNTRPVLSAYRHFLDEAINVLILAGEDALAETMFQRATENRPGFSKANSASELMRTIMAQQMQSMAGDEMSGLVSSLLLRSYWWKGRGNGRKSNAMLSRAQLLWQANAAKNKVAERSINRNFQDLKLAILVDIFRRDLFHPDIRAGLRGSLGEDTWTEISAALEEV